MRQNVNLKVHPILPIPLPGEMMSDIPWVVTLG